MVTRGETARPLGAPHATKTDGVRMGPARTSCSIAKSHGGRSWATGNTPYGAVFQCTLPTGRAA
jgi:signal transduction histidine kinase